MRLTTSTSIIFYLFLLWFLPAQGFEASQTSLFIRKECQQYLDSQCLRMPEGVRRSLEACEIAKKAHRCDQLAAENPEIKDLIISCNPREFCEQISMDGTDEALACWRGLKGSVSDTAEALAALAEAAWDKLKNARLSNFHLPTLSSPQLPGWEESRKKISALWSASEDLAREKYHQYACYTPQAKEELKCYAFATVVDPTLVLGKGARLARAERLMASSGKTLTKNLSKEAFTRHYLHYSPTSKEQNLQWMKQADETPKGVKFFDVENSVMKKLNDGLKDKNLVTSLTNYHKNILQNRVQKLYLELKNEHRDLELMAYSDFKASRFAFKGQGPPDLEERLNKVLQETNQEFSDYVTKNKYVKTADQPENWFRAGYGETADQATLASRFSRQSQGNQLQSYSAESLKNTLTQKNQSVEKMRRELQGELGRSSVMVGENQKTLSPDAFDILRKNGDDLKKSQADLQNRFGLKELPLSSVQKMQSYAKSVDEFSPGIHIAQREVATLDEAVMGGLSADMVGMGAKNLHATAKALAVSRDLDEVLKETRRQEKLITESFQRQKQTFQEILKEVVGADRIHTVCSGDDCTALPKQVLSDREKQSILQKLSAAGHASDFRLSFIPEKIPQSAARSQLAVHGEAIEKALRKNLADKMEPAKLKGVLFGVDMKTTTLNQGGVKLLTATSPQVKLSESERQIIQQSFQKALEQINQDLSTQGKKGSYRVWNP